MNTFIVNIQTDILQRRCKHDSFVTKRFATSAVISLEMSGEITESKNSSQEIFFINYKCPIDNTRYIKSTGKNQLGSVSVQGVRIPLS